MLISAFPSPLGSSEEGRKLARFRVTRFVTTAFLVLASAVVGVVVAAPAEAASKCYTNSKAFTPLYHPVLVDVTTCVKVTGNVKQAYAQVDWAGRGSMGRRFDEFRVQIRLEFSDYVHTSKVCDFTYELNDQYDGSKTCTTSTYSSGANSGGWTGDGVVYYNLEADGKGELDPWALHGSPEI